MEKKEEMEKLPFKKADLIEDLKIKKMGELILAKLINYNVKILISINPHGDIYLVGFYKQPGIQIKGITRCALYVLLKELLEKGIIQRDQKMKVSAPTPDDGNLERLIKIYTEIGFILGEPEPGHPTNLYNTVGNLIESLKRQCEIIVGGKRRRKTKKMRKKMKNKTRKHSKKMSKKPRRVGGKIYFEDHPEFRPNLSPRQIFKMGSFGGTYWRPIKSKFYDGELRNKHKKYGKLGWWKGIPEHHLTSPFDKYDTKINKYEKKVGTTLSFWEGKNWIDKQDPYGWVQWYCEFYTGRRSKDDSRQIARFNKLAGPKGRFRKWLVTQIMKKGGKSKWNDHSVSPAIRQTLQHWAYKLTKKDFNDELKERKNK